MAIVNLDKDKEEEQEDNKPRTAKLLGFDGGKAEGEWLSKYPVNTEFLTERTKTQYLPDGRPMPKSFDLQKWTIFEKGRRGVYLSLAQPDGSAQGLWVNPILFCLSFGLYEILTLGVDDEEGPVS